MPTTTPRRYAMPTIGLHWLMLLLLIAVYATVQLHEVFPKGSALRGSLMTLHFSLGMLVFCLVWLRLALRLFGTTPPIEPPLNPWMLRLAGLMHLALYGVMIGLPLLGWLMLNAAGKPVPFFGLELPALIAEHEAAAELLEEVHEAVGEASYFLIGLHAGAALIHHYILRDNTLARMLPARR